MVHARGMSGPELPPTLAGRAFTVSAAYDTGVRTWELRRLGLHRPTRSVRCPTPPTTPRERAEAFLPALPGDAVYSHVTAAQLLMLPLPRIVTERVDLDVMRPTVRQPVRRAGCRGHRGSETRQVIDVRGLPVVALADTWCDLGEVVGDGLDLDDLVVVADTVATRLDDGKDALPGTGVRALRSRLGSRVRPRGARLLAAALELARSGSRSPMETRARLMFHRAGFPEPELNGAVHFTAGGWMLDGDLVWRAQRVIGEYQGADHASRRRRSGDAGRAGLAEEEGWRVLEIWAEDVFQPSRRERCLTRFAGALDLDPAMLSIG